MGIRIPSNSPSPRGSCKRARRIDPCRRSTVCRLSIEPLEARRVPASLTIGDAVIVEGNAGIKYAEVVVSLSAASNKTVTVNYNTADEVPIAGIYYPATAGVDYQAASGKLSFAPGQRSKTIRVAVIGDRLGEQDETFSVKLSGARNARIADSTGLVTIQDDDPRISIGDAWVSEGNTGKTLMTFTVSLSAAQAQAVTVDYATQDGLAYAGEDYVATSGRLTFAPGETTKTITVEIIGDTVPEPDEPFFVNLGGATANVFILKGQGIGTILDDDGWVDPGSYGWYEGGSYS